MVAPHSKQKFPILKYQLCPGEALIYIHKTYRVLVISAQHYPRHAFIRVKEKSFFPRPSLNCKIPLHTHPLPAIVCLVPNNFATTLCIQRGSSVIQTEGGPGAVQCVDGGTWTMQWA